MHQEFSPWQTQSVAKTTTSHGPLSIIVYAHNNPEDGAMLNLPQASSEL